ncbi:hypothetical protein NJF44_22820 [Pseudomonas guariconensis]|uniref:hypothetical protein n=1 Tax=Pseudomonas TaxID=286 RepID=UPI0020969279|nr:MULTISPECIES: hypothetical protein [Pseudomonas]MCO7643299.1 hypothetical protein [Pseudomonas sp. S 311-6]MCO7517621.1 hypothetical protein [Pseudomonas putida]MCO7567850.1 hypothetical protein [Pseudomonas mosselii]MCO7608073.1 hypothetical protein [Pseudomonas guariconensis]MCO7619257.1 hypothetical protein [Pseudomonas guariconensis]
MNQAKSFALFALALTLAGCANDASNTPSLGWSMPGMQLGGDRGLPLQVDTPCRKRGCDNDKLFFNPGKPEPGVNTIHRGW